MTKIIETNTQTGDSILRDATKEELQKLKDLENKYITEKAEAEAKTEAKMALLDRLGITEDEAKLLLI